MVENETGLKVKRLRSDNGGEYKNRRFRDFCVNNGIKMETIVPMTPQQNGVADRMNRTLNERARNSAKRSKPDAKSNKCVFVGYGGDEFDCRFWDYENRKIIRSIYVIFNENVIYKERSTVESSSSNTEAETKEFAEFEEISRNDVQINPEAVQEEPGTPELRRSSRIPKPTQRHSPSLHYLLLTDNSEPECYDEAKQVEDSVKKNSKISGFTGSKNNTMGANATKQDWLSKAFSKKKLDVKTAFLHGDLEEEIYMRQPEGFIKADKKNLVCRLKKSLYGLKQAPRQWYKKFDNFMGSNGFTICQADHYCYIKRFDNSFIILLLYVDDMLVAGSNMHEIINLKQKLSKQFAMKDLGTAKQILGMRIKRDTKSGTLMLSQAEYINKVLSRFNMQDAKLVSTPLGVHFRLSKEQSPKKEEELAHMVKVSYASTIGSLMYAMVCTRPDIAHAVGAVSRYMNNPGKVHWEAVKWILRYLRGTKNKALCFKSGDTKLTGYVDADLAENVDIRRYTTRYVYTLGGTAVSWVSQLQKIFALSTTEAEYVAVTEASKEMVWLQSFLEELGKKQENNVLYCDSQSVIHLAKNPYFHSRTKHIQLRYHFIRSLLEDEILKLEKISGAQNPTDMLTKTVTADKLNKRSAAVWRHRHNWLNSVINFSVINVLSGIGLLTTPYAVKEGGWMSLTLLIIFGVVACYTDILLKRCLESSPGLHTYPDIGQAAFGVAGRFIVAVTLIFTKIKSASNLKAACVEYVIIMSDNTSTIFPNTSIHIGGIYLNAHQIFSIIGILIVLPTVWLRDLSLLSYLSVGGVGASILVVLCLLWVGAVDQVGFHRAGTTLNLANLPIYVGIYSFFYAGHKVIPDIYSSMKEPSLFPLVLILSFIFCWFICTGAAISGFLIFGDSIESQKHANKICSLQIAVCTVVIITISKYALTLTPIASGLEELVPSKWSRSYGVSILIRTALTISTLVVAMTVPFFAFLMALAGSLLTMLITIIFPCACYLSILGGKLTNLQMGVCIFIAIVGFLIACDGTYSALIR
ncbi:Retrovirus-related Pol polyprotein from transposon TNT 1-94 [Hibiscus syriacus]|uniref:Retrovirus-related Pol polyprotein from transposon TNT 1-94 n=1 Tax=Hibiscus syriacus TaxID=106335 RepID=A0A6A2WXP1_HIBSY|nr:Retrovirus-related Pol polyprotein from transposon TNT 1-94 [Hibiscus syriacus]